MSRGRTVAVGLGLGLAILLAVSAPDTGGPIPERRRPLRLSPSAPAPVEVPPPPVVVAAPAPAVVAPASPEVLPTPVVAPSPPLAKASAPRPKGIDPMAAEAVIEVALEVDVRGPASQCDGAPAFVRYALDFDATGLAAARVVEPLGIDPDLELCLVSAVQAGTWPRVAEPVVGIWPLALMPP